MRRKGFYRNAGRGRGRGGYGRWQAMEDAPGYGPPPWAPRWGWGEDVAAPMPQDASFGPPPWGRGARMWGVDEMEVADRKAWLEARKARLLAWKQHLETRLAETEAELEALNQAPEASDLNESQ